MRVVVLSHAADFAGWREAARALAGAGVAPSDVTWQVAGEQSDLLSALGLPTPDAGQRFSVPRRFIERAEQVVCHRDPQRFGLLYELLTRLRDNPKLIDDRADPLVHKVEAMERAVARDMHKMRAFLRFREVADDDGARYVAWFEPEHHIVRANADFFVRRFANLRWSILTPDLAVHWDGASLDFTPGTTKADAPEADALEATWRTYYASTFNPARLKVRAMQREMPKKYWRNMPETVLVPELIASAASRTDMMIDAGSTPAVRDMADSDPSVAPDSLAAVARAAKACTRCHLYEKATQTVFGDGPETAPLMFVGEQPGDQEDLAGKPFVGPAGQMFNRALADAAIDRGQTYVTNAVKHFKFEQRGKRRIHQKPEAPEIKACHYWLEHERALIRPKLTVALGATAARALLGRVVTISKTRGAPITLADGTECWVTIHPSFLLRIEDESYAQVEYARFVEDLAAIKARLAALERAAIIGQEQ